MINVGDVIEIGGKKATVCYTTIYNNQKYMCVAFEEEQVRYDIYSYIDDDNKLMVAKVTDEEEITPVVKIFYEEGLNEYGLPPEIEDFLDNN